MAREIHTVADGLRVWKLNYFRSEFRQRITVVEIDGTSHAISVQAALGGGLWNGEAIDRVRERESALAAWQALDQPFSGPSLAWPGLTVVDGALIASPADGPTFTVTPDGFMELSDSSESPHELGRLRAGDRLDLAVDWINRPATTDTLGFVTDPGVLRDSVLAGLSPLATATMQFQAVQPLLWAAGAGARGRSVTPWMATARGEYGWSSETATDLLPDKVFDQNWVGVAGARGGAARVTEALARPASGTFRFAGGGAWSDYRAAVPLGEWLVRRGRIVVPRQVREGDPRGVRTARSGLGIRPDDNHLWLVIAWDRERDAEGLTEYELAELLLALGATEAGAGPQGEAVAASVQGEQVVPAGRVPASCRLAIVVKPFQAPSANQWVNLSTLTQPIVSGTPSLDWRTTADRVIDGRQGIRPKLDHFWASEGTESAPPTLEFDLRREFEVGQIDLVHAEDAGFSPELDARQIRISCRRKGDSRWTVATTAENDPPRRRQHVLLDPPVRAQGLRLEFTRPNSLAGNRTARLVEVVLWGR